MTLPMGTEFFNPDPGSDPTASVALLRIAAGTAPGEDTDRGAVTFAGLDCEGYRLATEAEWEYAARVETTTATYNGDLTATDCPGMMTCPRIFGPRGVLPVPRSRISGIMRPLFVDVEPHTRLASASPRRSADAGGCGTLLSTRRSRW